MAQHRVSPTQARVLALLASGERLIHYRKFHGVPTYWSSSETPAPLSENPLGIALRG